MKRLDVRDIAFLSGFILSCTGAYLVSPPLIISILGALVMYFAVNMVEEIPTEATPAVEKEPE